MRERLVAAQERGRAEAGGVEQARGWSGRCGVDALDAGGPGSKGA
jgi:hypothetical protein